MAKMRKIPQKQSAPGYSVWNFARTVREAENVARWNPWLAHEWMSEAKDMLSLELPEFSKYDQVVDRINERWLLMADMLWFNEKTFWALEGVEYPATYLSKIQDYNHSTLESLNIARAKIM